MPVPFDQSRYQVRFERGLAGLHRLAPADIVVVVDVLTSSTWLTDAVARGEVVSLAGANGLGRDHAQAAVGDSGTGNLDSETADSASIFGAAADAGALVLAGSLRNPAAVARGILTEQERRGVRTSIAVISVGDASAGELRVAVEDDLGAGAVIDALAALGLDHSSPEAAAVCEGFRGLRGAVRHLLTASGTGQALIEHGLADEVRAAGQIDATDAVPVLRDGVFVAFA